MLALDWVISYFGVYKNLSKKKQTHLTGPEIHNFPSYTQDLRKKMHSCQINLKRNRNSINHSESSISQENNKKINGIPLQYCTVSGILYYLIISERLRLGLGAVEAVLTKTWNTGWVQCLCKQWPLPVLPVT